MLCVWLFRPNRLIPRALFTIIIIVPERVVVTAVSVSPRWVTADTVVIYMDKHTSSMCTHVCGTRYTGNYNGRALSTTFVKSEKADEKKEKKKLTEEDRGKSKGFQRTYTTNGGQVTSTRQNRHGVSSVYK